MDLDRTIEDVLNFPKRDPEVLERNAEALRNRLHDVFFDLGVPELTPTVRVIPDGGNDVIVEFPVLGRRTAEHVLNRLTDVARDLPAPVQVHQNTSLF